MKYPFKSIHQNGDTIVEVLIALAVISSVLVGAFQVSQKSMAAVRSSQEHSELLQLLQGQVELTRSLALDQTDASSGVFAATPTFFCVDGTAPSGPAMVPQSSLGGALQPLGSDNFGSYASGCRDLGGRYNVATKYDSTTKVFTFTGRWDGPGGNRAQETLVYRIYPGRAIVAATASIPSTTPAVPSPTPAPSPDGDVKLTGLPITNCLADRQAAGKNPYPDCWNISVINASDNPPGVLDHCELYWGDGTKVESYSGSSAECQKGFFFSTHTYPNKGSTYKQDKYTITLTNFFKDSNLGSKEYKFPNIYVPY